MINDYIPISLRVVLIQQLHHLCHPNDNYKEDGAY